MNGNPERPAVWVFDPHSRRDPVHRVAINDETELHKVINHIQDRLERAAAMK